MKQAIVRRRCRRRDVDHTERPAGASCPAIREYAPPSSDTCQPGTPSGDGRTSACVQATVAEALTAGYRAAAVPGGTLHCRSSCQQPMQQDVSVVSLENEALGPCPPHPAPPSPQIRSQRSHRRPVALPAPRSSCGRCSPYPSIRSRRPLPLFGWYEAAIQKSLAPVQLALLVQRARTRSHMCSHTPCSSHSCKRRWQVEELPYRSGRSFQRAPDRRIQRMPIESGPIVCSWSPKALGRRQKRSYHFPLVVS